MARFRGSVVLAAVACVVLFASVPRQIVSAQAKPQQVAVPAQPFAVEYYYKVKWGHFDEFLDLYKRNHYPILQRLAKMGRIVSMSAAYPINHASEASRWDLRFTIAWKDAATAYEDFDQGPIVKELYPDQEKFKKEEQRRFEILVEHMDVPVFLDNLKEWR